MKTSFLNYSMSVIVSRALPDVRDGLKPSSKKNSFMPMNDFYGWANNTQQQKISPYCSEGKLLVSITHMVTRPIYEAMVKNGTTISRIVTLRLMAMGTLGSVMVIRCGECVIPEGEE